MKRLIYAPLALAIFLGMIAGQGHAAEAASLPCSASAGHVTVVVEHSPAVTDGNIQQRCVGIDGSSATAQTVLSSSDLESASAGGELCQVDNEPTSFTSPCLQPSDPYYWAIFFSINGKSWQYSSYGISTLQLSSGESLGLRYETGSSVPVLPSIACPPPASSAQSLSSNRSLSASSGAAPLKQTASAPSSAAHVAPTNQPLQTKTPTGAVLAIHSVAADPHPLSNGGAINWTILFACLAGGGLLGLGSVQVARR
jgi:hypothetical protein